MAVVAAGCMLTLSEVLDSLTGAIPIWQEIVCGVSVYRKHLQNYFPKIWCTRFCNSLQKLHHASTEAAASSSRSPSAPTSDGHSPRTLLLPSKQTGPRTSSRNRLDLKTQIQTRRCIAHFWPIASSNQLLTRLPRAGCCRARAAVLRSVRRAIVRNRMPGAGSESTAACVGGEPGNVRAGSSRPGGRPPAASQPPLSRPGHLDSVRQPGSEPRPSQAAAAAAGTGTQSRRLSLPDYHSVRVCRTESPGTWTAP